MMTKTITTLLCLFVFISIATAQDLKGYWLGKISNPAFPPHSMLYLGDDQVYIYGQDMNTIIDSLEIRADHIINKRYNYRGQLGLLKQELQIEALTKSSYQPIYDRFIKLAATTLLCSDKTLNHLRGKLYCNSAELEYTMSTTLDPDVIANVDPDYIEEAMMLQNGPYYFLAPADREASEFIFPILEINDDYILVYDTEEEEAVKVFLSF